MAAVVVSSTKSGQMQIEDKSECHGHMQQETYSLQIVKSVITNNSRMHIKGIVLPNIKTSWKCTPTIQDIDEFGSSWEQIWRNLALDPLQWMGAVRMSPNSW